MPADNRVVTPPEQAAQDWLMTIVMRVFTREAGRQIPPMALITIMETLPAPLVVQSMPQRMADRLISDAVWTYLATPIEQPEGPRKPRRGTKPKQPQEPQEPHPYEAVALPPDALKRIVVRGVSRVARAIDGR